MLYLCLKNYLKRFSPVLIVVVKAEGERGAQTFARLPEFPENSPGERSLPTLPLLFDLVILFEFIVRFNLCVPPCWYLPYLLSDIAFS